MGLKLYNIFVIILEEGLGIKFYIKHFIANEIISIFPRNYVNFKMNHIDIYLCDMFDKNIRMNGFPEIIFRNFHICDLMDINLNNINFPCMQHCEKFLSWKYGPDWNIPRFDADINWLLIHQ